MTFARRLSAILPWLTLAIGLASCAEPGARESRANNFDLLGTDDPKTPKRNFNPDDWQRALALDRGSLPSIENLPKGQVQAYIVTGDVRRTGTDSNHLVERGETFSDGETITTAPGANTLLVFSNGETVKANEKTQFEISIYRQEPFDEATLGTYLRLSKDPSKSVTLLHLRYGTLQGEMKKISSAASSIFGIKTPVGYFWIKGVFILEVGCDEAGRIDHVFESCVTGSNQLTPTREPPKTDDTPGPGAIFVPMGGQFRCRLDPATGKILELTVMGPDAR